MTTTVLIIGIGLLALCAVQVAGVLLRKKWGTTRLQIVCGTAGILLEAIALFLRLHTHHGFWRELPPALGMPAGYILLYLVLQGFVIRRREARLARVRI